MVRLEPFFIRISKVIMLSSTVLLKVSGFSNIMLEEDATVINANKNLPD